MKYLRLLNSDDGFVVDEVDGTTPSWCQSAFIYKDEYNVFHLVDKESGLSICRSRKRKLLQNMYAERELAYETYKHTDAYKIKVERFEKMKLVSNYSKGVK